MSLRLRHPDSRSYGRHPAVSWASFGLGVSAFLLLRGATIRRDFRFTSSDSIGLELPPRPLSRLAAKVAQDGCPDGSY